MIWIGDSVAMKHALRGEPCMILRIVAAVQIHSEEGRN